MSLEYPLALLGLVVVPVLAWLWLVQDQRRRRSAAAFSNLALIPNIVDRSPGRLRFVAPALLLLALTALVVGFSRPHANITVPRHEATVVLAIDTSRSMQATDIAPTRMIAAERAADTFLDNVPSEYAVAVVGIGSRPYVAVPPTTDRSIVKQAIRDLAPGEGTAMGDAIVLAAKLGQKQRSIDGVVPPESVLLLSDGAPDGGKTSVAVAVKRAKKLHVPISTVALGTPAGIVHAKLVGGYTEQIRVPPSIGTLQLIAKGTGGDFFTARSAKALDEVYRHLATRIGHRSENREITDAFVGAALLLLVAAGAFSVLRFRRLP